MSVDVDPFHRADLPSPRTPADDGVAPGILGDATVWALFGMIFASVASVRAGTRARADERDGSPP